MIQWPESLIGDLARRRSILLVGSGVSKHSIGAGGVRPPNWKEFLAKAIHDCPGGVQEHIVAAYDKGDYLHACEWLKSRFDEGWTDYLRETFQVPGYAPSSLHHALIGLDARVVLSLNFDDIYERAANAYKAGSYIVKNYYDSDVSEFLRGNGRYIVKVHGSLNSPDRLIFTQRDYANARVNHGKFYQAFDASLLTNSFVFVGAGFSDPDINLLLENQMFSFPSSQPHYFLSSTPSNDDLKKSLRNNRNLKIVEYEKVDDDHSGLVSEIEALGELVEEKRHELSLTTNW